MRRTLGLFSLALALFAAPLSAFANADFGHSTPGVSGYDVVSYQTGEKPLRGNGNHIATHEGVTYLFINEDNREAFEQNPSKYVPAYGGFCAFGVSVGKKLVGDPDVWRVVDGQLYLNLDTKIQALWVDDIPKNIRKADANWTKIQDKDPATL